VVSVSCGLEQFPKRHELLKDWTMCLDFDNHFLLNSHHNATRDPGEHDLYDHLMSTKIFTLIVNKIFTRAPNITRNYNLDLKLLTISYQLRALYPRRNWTGWTKKPLKTHLPYIGITHIFS
jgi:hypothetical protein